jgi:DNA-binding PadR family transcriptional regulator
MEKDEATKRDEESIPNLSGKEAVVLEMLLTTGRELFGLEMVEASGGLLKRGTVYVTLQRMEEKGLIESRQEARPGAEIGIPRRLYRATGLGARAFRERQQRYQRFSTSLIPVGG